MQSVCRVAHALAVSLWFGSVAFFTVAGLLIFQAMDEAARTDAPWLSQETLNEVEELPPWKTERGSRAAGVVVSRIFPVYFALQAVCAIVALGTAYVLGGRVRLVVCLLGFLVVCGGWLLNEKVSALRQVRNAKADKVYRGFTKWNVEVASAQQARQAFGTAHGISLLANFTALGLSCWLACLLGCSTPPEPREAKA